MYLGQCLLVMLLLVGGASVSWTVPIGHVVTCGQGQCILDSAYWSCCYLWAGPVYLGQCLLVMLLLVGGASVSWTVPIGHVVTCGWGQCILDSAYWSCCYLWAGPVYLGQCLLVMLLLVGRASVSWTVPIGHVVTCGQGQCILDSAYWSCCYLWVGPVYLGQCLLVMLLLVGGASVSWTVPIGHVVTCGQGQCILDSAYWSCCYLWVGPVYLGQCLLVMLVFVLGASVSWIVPIGHVGICA